MRQKFFIKSSCQGNKLFLFEIVCFKTTTESLGNIFEFIALCHWRQNGQTAEVTFFANSNLVLKKGLYFALNI